LKPAQVAVQRSKPEKACFLECPLEPHSELRQTGWPAFAAHAYAHLPKQSCADLSIAVITGKSSTMFGEVISGGAGIERSCDDVQSRESSTFGAVSAIQAVVNAAKVF